MSPEHVIVLLTGAVGLAAAAWKLFVEIDSWRRNRRREPPVPPAD